MSGNGGNGDGVEGVEGVEVSAETLFAVAEIQAAAARTLRRVRAARDELLAVARRYQPREPPRIDGEPAVVDGTPVDPVSWLCDRLEGCCLDGGFVALLRELEPEVTGDPVERLAAFVRRHRRESRGGPGPA